MPKPTEAYLGGHAMMAVGYDDQSHEFLARNSWSKRWGIDGYCWIPYDYLTPPPTWPPTSGLSKPWRLNDTRENQPPAIHWGLVLAARASGSSARPGVVGRLLHSGQTTQWKQAKTGISREQGSNDSPDAEALRNFRRAIYAGDVDAAKRLYLRLLDYCFTAKRFEAGIKASEPLAGLSAKDGSRRAFVEGLSAYDRKMLDKAQDYELRMSSMKLDARRIFPMEIKAPPPATRRMVDNFRSAPSNELIESEVKKAADN